MALPVLKASLSESVIATEPEYLLEAGCVNASSQVMDVPYAKDGSFFGPHLMRNGGFWIGNKGGECQVDSFEEALRQLRGMDKAKWRRPNEKGNWGIVAAIEWKELPDTDIG